MRDFRLGAGGIVGPADVRAGEGRCCERIAAGLGIDAA